MAHIGAAFKKPPRRGITGGTPSARIPFKQTPFSSSH